MFALWAMFQFSWGSDKREEDTDHECFENDSLIESAKPSVTSCT